MNASRRQVRPSRRSGAAARIAKRSTTSIAANASQAARERVITSDAVTSAAPMAFQTSVRRRWAVTARKSSSGRPNAATWAMKLRLPRVPPGARFSEKSSMSRPYVCRQRRHRRGDDRQRQPADQRAADACRAVQKIKTLDTLTASARNASHRLVAKSADRTLSPR